VVGDEQVVVHGFGDVKGTELVAGVRGHIVDDVAGVGGIVAADIEEVSYVAFFKDVENLSAIVFVGFVPA